MDQVTFRAALFLQTTFPKGAVRQLTIIEPGSHAMLLIIDVLTLILNLRLPMIDQAPSNCSKSLLIFTEKSTK